MKHTISSLILSTESGDRSAADALFASLYSELHRLAKNQLARRGPSVTLSPTTLLHEAYLNIAGREAAESGSIVTFGIKPSEPKTSYGYILRGEAIGKNGVNKVKSFVEKPDVATAARYVADGYLWNSGNFLFRGDVLLSELKRLEPAMAEAVEASVARATKDLGFLRLQPEAFARSNAKSIDYAVMEKTDRAAVVAGDFRWSDIGSWDALFDITPHDASGNVVHGPVVTLDTSGNPWVLSWDLPAIPDFASACVYRGDTSGFTCPKNCPTNSIDLSGSATFNILKHG